MELILIQLKLNVPYKIPILPHFKAFQGSAVFFNFSFETEPIAATLIAHGTHGCGQKFDLGALVTSTDFNQTPLIQHIYPPHHVVRIGMLDSQQSRRTSN